MFVRIKKSLKGLAKKVFLSCQDVTEMASRTLETNLLWRERLKLKLHLWQCIACQRYLSQLKFMKRVFELRENEIRNSKTLPALDPKVAERLKKAIRNSKY